MEISYKIVIAEIGLIWNNRLTGIFNATKSVSKMETSIRYKGLLIQQVQVSQRSFLHTRLEAEIDYYLGELDQRGYYLRIKILPATAMKTRIETIELLCFTSGGYHSSFNIKLEFKDGVIQYSNSLFPIPDSEEQIVIKVAKPKNVDKLIYSLNELSILQWKTSYNSDICDGNQWGFELKYNNGKVKSIYGSNNYPKTFDVLLEILENFSGETIITDEEE